MFAPKQWIKRPILSQKNPWAVCLLLLCITISLSGCGNRSVRESWDFDGLRLTLSSPKFHYELGDEVTVNVKVENTTNETIRWESLDTEDREYVFEVYVDGVALSSVYPELQVYSRDLAPGEKIEFTYSFIPENREEHDIWIKAYFYNPRGTSQGSKSIFLKYGGALYGP